MPSGRSGITDEGAANRRATSVEAGAPAPQSQPVGRRSPPRSASAPSVAFGLRLRVLAAGPAPFLTVLRSRRLCERPGNLINRIVEPTTRGRYSPPMLDTSRGRSVTFVHVDSPRCRRRRCRRRERAKQADERTHATRGAGRRNLELRCQGTRPARPAMGPRRREARSVRTPSSSCCTTRSRAGSRRSLEARDAVGVGSEARWPWRPERKTQAWMPPTALRMRDAELGLPGF
jgi:hypothetical protein